MYKSVKTSNNTTVKTFGLDVYSQYSFDNFIASYKFIQLTTNVTHEANSIRGQFIKFNSKFGDDCTNLFEFLYLAVLLHIVGSSALEYA